MQISNTFKPSRLTSLSLEGETNWSTRMSDEVKEALYFIQ